MTRELVIAAEDDDEKSRSFRAPVLAEVFADTLVPGANGATTARPAWMMLATSTAEAGPFVANLRLGRKAEVAGTGRGRSAAERYELLRSLGYAFAGQRHAEGAVVTAYLPDLFALDPGMVDTTGARFIVLAERRWLERGAMIEDPAGVAAELGHEIDEALARDLALVAPLFCAYLDRRTRAPLVPSARFYFRVLLACLRDGAASLPTTRGGYMRETGFGQHSRFALHASDIDAVGLLPPIAFDAKHDAIEALLADEAREHFGIRRAA